MPVHVTPKVEYQGKVLELISRYASVYKSLIRDKPEGYDLLGATFRDLRHRCLRIVDIRRFIFPVALY
jgi:hypothetical protein